VLPPKPPPERRYARQRSRVTNGKALFIDGSPHSAQARRFADILAQIVSDLGGVDAPLSEGQRQLARRAASLSVSCELLEQAILAGVSSAAEAQLQAASGGLSSYAILREAGRALHGIARARGGGGNSISELAKLPDAQLDRVTDLLCRAGDLAAKAIAAGSAQSADLELLGLLSDRLGRTFGRLGMARVPREVGHITALNYAKLRDQFSPLKSSLAREQQPVDADVLEPVDEAAEP
jgi:hypothetical protein